MELFLTHSCNLNCRYCYNGRHFERSMSPTVMKAAVRLAFNRGTGPVTVSFFGGEPLLKFGLMQKGIELSRKASKETGRDVRFQMTTNATLLSGKRLDAVVREGIRINVSLDGTRTIHDAARPFRNGRGSYDRVAENLTSIRKRSDDVTVTTVVGPGNVGDAATAIRHIQSLGIRTIHLALDYHSDWTDGDVHRLRRSLDDVGDLWVEAYRKGKPLSLPSFDSKIARHVLQPLVSFSRCACGDREWTAAPSGRIYPCDRMVGEDDGSGPVIGDVFNGFDEEASARFLGCHRGTPEKCRECGDADRCLFWASCVKWGLTGDIDEPPDRLCDLEGAIIGAADRAAARLFDESNPVFLRRFYQGRYARKVLDTLGLRPDVLFDE